MLVFCDEILCKEALNIKIYNIKYKEPFKIITVHLCHDFL